MTLQKLRVPIGFAYGLAYLATADPTPAAVGTGIVLAFLGLLLRVWASGHIEKSRTLTITGPYRWTRNPLYLGSFLIGAGFTLAGAQWWLALLFPLLFFGIYLPVMRIEEQEMEKIFGSEYREYRRRTPLFLPSGRRGSDANRRPSGNFQWRRVILNREYKAVAGFFAIALLIIWKL